MKIHYINQETVTSDWNSAKLVCTLLLKKCGYITGRVKSQVAQLSF